MFTVKFDGYVTQIHEKQLYQNVEFELMDSNGKGAYLIVDGG